MPTVICPRALSCKEVLCLHRKYHEPSDVCFRPSVACPKCVEVEPYVLPEGLAREAAT